MAILRYLRRDLIIRLIAEPAAHRVEILDGGRFDDYVVPVEPEASPQDVARALWRDPRLLAALQRWFLGPRDPASAVPAGDPGFSRPFDRICLQVEDERLASLPLEEALREVLESLLAPGRPLIVRLQAVPPRVGQVPFTLPLRLLQLDPHGDFDLPGTVRNVFGSKPLKPSIVQAEQARLREFAHWELPAGWKTVDVLELDDTALDPERALLDSPDEIGSVGWLARATDLWRTRLLVMRGRGNLTSLRRVAQELTARGGPAIVVVDDAVPGAASQLPGFYDQLIHDTPFDAAIAMAGSVITPFTASWSGGGRAELLRVSGPGEKLATLARTSEATRYIRNMRTEAVPADRIITEAMQSGLDAIADRLPGWHFNEYERDGMIPLGEAIDNVRAAAGAAAVAPAELRPIAVPEEPRFANLGLWQLEPAGRGAAIAPDGARLKLAEPVVLGVQIGARQGYAPVLDAVALLEEPFKWSDGAAGVWLSVGVTGLDFEVKGALLQEVWLPRNGASDLVEFAVQPTRSGVSQIRVCLYYGADLLQSHRLAACVDQPALGEEDSAGSIAAALGVGRERVGAAGWLARMEYVAAGNLAAPPAGRDVALSIFASGEGDGQWKMAVRGAQYFEVEQLTEATTQRADVVRQKLDEVSRNAKEPQYYAFPGDGGALALNAAAPADRNAALMALAPAGFALYQQLFKTSRRESISKALDRDGSIIHVAHSLLEKVIPWAAIYDRKYDPEKTQEGGMPVKHDVCPAGFPDASGNFPVSACGSHDDCPLSAKRRAAAKDHSVTPDTIVCARHFWGFRHVIELPPYQTDAEAGTASAAPRRETVTQAGSPASMVLGYNDALKTIADHLSELRALLLDRKVSGKWNEQKARDPFLDALGAATDLVYLFCHARDSDADPKTRLPALVFKETNGVPVDAIRPPALDGVKLSHHPLVILNGCNTAKFSVEALSPFIRYLVRDCEAAGAIGTEIPVFEQLAGKVGVDFLKRFLDGEEAGAALLAVRRSLLAMGNPLGLAYTLYAVSELKMTQGPTVAPLP